MSQSTSNTYQKWLIILVLIFVLFLGLVTQAKAAPKHNVRLLLSPYSKYSKWIDAMARHESKNFKSGLATQYNNIFGMGFPYDRPASNVGKTAEQVEGQYMSAYKNYDQAIKDLIMWFDYKKFPTNIATVESFVHALKEKGYFTDSVSNYTNGLIRWMK